MLLVGNMISMRLPPFLYAGTGFASRWKLWALFSFVSLVASVGTWFTGQYQIGQLDSLKGRYDQPVNNFAKYFGNAPGHSLERDLLEGCKQAQIGSWLQTTDALRFDGPLTGNRIDVRLDSEKAFLNLNGRELSDCIQDEVEDRQFDIGSMTNTWAIILLLASLCLAGWAWICHFGALGARKARNIYAETLAETESPPVTDAESPEPIPPADSEKPSP